MQGGIRSRYFHPFRPNCRWPDLRLGKFQCLELYFFLHYCIWAKSRRLFLGQAFIVWLCLQYDNPTRITQTRISNKLQILQVSIELSFILLKIEIKKSASIMCVVLLWCKKLFYSQTVKKLDKNDWEPNK